MTRRALTPSETKVYQWLVRAAGAGEPCPKNDEIAEFLACKSSAGASNVISALANKGWIDVQRGNCTRVVTIIDTGQSTAGHVTKPHWRFKGQTPKANSPVAAPNHRANNPVAITARVAERAAEREELAEANYTHREPCFWCGVRADMHAQFGCGRRV